MEGFELPKGYEEQTGLGFWKPLKIGEKLEGSITDTKDTDYGRSWQILTSEGESIWTPSNKVLQNRMALAQVGDKVHIIYTGDEMPKVKGHKPTMMFMVGIKK